MQLPPGKKPLRTIEQQSDPAQRVIDLTILLDFALATLDPTSASDRPLAPSDRIKLHSAHFSSLRDLLFAIGVRNDLVHATSAARRTPGAAEIKRAAKILRQGLLEILPRVPPELAAEIVRDSHVDKERTRRPKAKPSRSGAAPGGSARAEEGIDPGSRSRLLLGAGLLLLAIVALPPLVRRALHGSVATTEPFRRDALEAEARLGSLANEAPFAAAWDSFESEIRAGNRWWSRLEYDAAYERYRAAIAKSIELDALRAARDVARQAREAALAARSRAMLARAPEDAAVEWNAALEALATAERDLATGANHFGRASFDFAAAGFAATETIASERRAARIASSLEEARRAESEGRLATALDAWLAAARDGDVAARETFDRLAPRHPEFWVQRADAALRGNDELPVPDRLRAMIALAERNAPGPPSLTAERLLRDGSREALRITEPRVAADFLLTIARLQMRQSLAEDAATTLQAAIEALSVVPRDPDAVLRYAQLAALAERVDDTARHDEWLRIASETLQASTAMASFPLAIQLADSGRYDEALARAIELRELPEVRDYALIALSWIAWRAADDGELEIHRKARLAATEIGLEGATARGGIAMFQFVRADVALGRIAEAESLRTRITHREMRAAADYAVAELRARRDEIDLARGLFDGVEHKTSPFGSSAAAEIAAALARDSARSAYELLAFAEYLSYGDVRCAALGAAAQEFTQRR